MNAVPRHIFVDEALAIRAYEDAPLPIGHGQTISQPWVVARMTELARNGRELDRRARDRHRLRLSDRGARAAREDRLHRRAHRRAGRQGAAPPAVAQDPQRAPRRTATAAPTSARTSQSTRSSSRPGATHVPTPLLKYLKPGGRMVLPLAQREEGERGIAAPHRDRGERVGHPGADVRCGKIRAAAAGSRLNFQAARSVVGSMRSPLSSVFAELSFSHLRRARRRLARCSTACATRQRAPVEDRTFPRPPPPATSVTPASAQPAPPKRRQRPTYTVKRGDTLHQIALDQRSRLPRARCVEQHREHQPDPRRPGSASRRAGRDAGRIGRRRKR